MKAHVAKMSQQPTAPKKILLTIEGNIGSGKSTMIKQLREHYPHFRIIDEPVDQWTQMCTEQGESLLELFYKDKTRWSYTFQNCAFITRYISATKALAEPVTEDTIFISERGILTDRHVFATMLHDSKCLSKIEWELYSTWFAHFESTCKPMGIIYITTDSTICSDRIKIRNRQGESGIPQAYLDELDIYHERWLNNSDIPVLRISSDKENVHEINSFANKFIHQ
jgi:deoxyguanosine kinase